MENVEMKKAQTLAEKKWGKPPDRGETVLPHVRSVERIGEGAASALFPGCRVYQVGVFNPQSLLAGPLLLYYALARNGHEAAYLENDEEAAAWLGKMGWAQAKTLEEARVFARRWAALRHYELREGPLAEGEMQSFLGQRFMAEDWTLVCRPQGGDWLVEAAFYTSPDISAYVRYRFVIAPGGKAAVTSLKFMSAGGYD